MALAAKKSSRDTLITPNAVADKNIGEVEQELDNLETEILALNTFSQELVEKLVPILRDEPPMMEAEGGPSRCLVPLAERIRGLRFALEGANSRIAGLIHRIEL